MHFWVCYAGTSSLMVHGLFFGVLRQCFTITGCVATGKPTFLLLVGVGWFGPLELQNQVIVTVSIKLRARPLGIVAAVVTDVREATGFVGITMLCKVNAANGAEDLEEFVKVGFLRVATNVGDAESRIFPLRRKHA